MEAQLDERLESAGFQNIEQAITRLASLSTTENANACLSRFLRSISELADADELLVDFQRFVQRSDQRSELYQFLIENPRAIEMLVKVFAGSRYLTESLLRDPNSLRQLIQHRSLADLKSRDEFVDAALEAAETADTFQEKLDALRRFQRSELLRIGICDAFGLVDFRAATVQLSRLAEGLIQSCLTLVCRELNVTPSGFCVLAMGKLGGDELNYSSDIDLIFLAETPQSQSSATLSEATLLSIAQRLIKALQDSTAEGFLYRVDMRLRPWGRAGQLVVRVPGYLDYLSNHAEMWEKQALLKARVVAGDGVIGIDLLKKASALIFGHPAELVRASVRQAKSQIESQLERRGRAFGEVKSGAGSIRDVEFVVQLLQLIHGQRIPHIRSANTLDALVRLADCDLIQADEYRCLTDGYVLSLIHI